MKDEITAYELAILIDLYGEELIDEMLEYGKLPDVTSSRTYKAEFERWVSHMEEDFAKKPHPVHNCLEL